ncbi:28464_t:CDS:2, partial [Racocetra persica]
AHILFFGLCQQSTLDRRKFATTIVLEFAEGLIKQAGCETRK